MSQKDYNAKLKAFSAIAEDAIKIPNMPGRHDNASISVVDAVKILQSHHINFPSQFIDIWIFHTNYIRQKKSRIKKAIAGYSLGSSRR